MNVFFPCEKLISAGVLSLSQVREAPGWTHPLELISNSACLPLIFLGFLRGFLATFVRKTEASGGVKAGGRCGCGAGASPAPRLSLAVCCVWR